MRTDAPVRIRERTQKSDWPASDGRVSNVALVRIGEQSPYRPSGVDEASSRGLGDVLTTSFETAFKRLPLIVRMMVAVVTFKHFD